MKQNMIKNMMGLFTIFLFTAVLFTNLAFAQDMDEQTQSEYKENLFAAAEKKILVGKYEEAIEIYDTMMENVRPIDYRIFEMKGIALSSLRLESTLAMQPQQNITIRDPTNLNESAMLEFYKALEIDPDSILALNGMGLGFGNFGEYSEAERYFKKSLKIEPNNKTTQNYLISLKNLWDKYSLDKFENPTKKPDFLQRLEEQVEVKEKKNTILD